VIVNQVDIAGMAILKAKDDTPIRPNSDTPEVLKISFEPVEPETRKVHVFGAGHTAENSEDVHHLLDILGVNALRFTVFEETFQASVPEALDHKSSLPRQATIVNNPMTGLTWGRQHACLCYYLLPHCRLLLPQPKASRRRL
jgi:hypothetical protein